MLASVVLLRWFPLCVFMSMVVQHYFNISFTITRQNWATAPLIQLQLICTKWEVPSKYYPLPLIDEWMKYYLTEVTDALFYTVVADLLLQSRLKQRVLLWPVTWMKKKSPFKAGLCGETLEPQHFYMQTADVVFNEIRILS